MAKQLMQVMEEFSGTLDEPGLVDEPVIQKGHPVYDPKTGAQVMKQVKGTVRTPVNVHKGKLYPAEHPYVKRWPHFFEEYAPKVEAHN